MQLTSDIKLPDITDSENKLASVVAMFKTFLEQYMSLELLRSKNSADLEHIHKNCLSTAQTLKKVEEMFMFNHTEKKPVTPVNPFINSAGAPVSSATNPMADVAREREAEIRRANDDIVVQEKTNNQQLDALYPDSDLKMPPMPTFPTWPNQQSQPQQSSAQNTNTNVLAEMQQYKRKISEYAVSLATDLNKIQSQIWEQQVQINNQLGETQQSMSDLRIKLNDLFKM